MNEQQIEAIKAGLMQLAKEHKGKGRGAKTRVIRDNFDLIQEAMKRSVTLDGVVEFIKERHGITISKPYLKIVLYRIRQERLNSNK